MGRSVILSNGRMLVGLNSSGLVHDFYYPYVGLENLTTARSAHHNIGVWVNGQFSWLDDGSWQVEVDFENEALVSSIRATHAELGLEINFSDFVDFQYTALCRQIKIRNSSAQPLDVRLFMHQVFQISRGGRSDTVLYVPGGSYILDYKGWFSLLIYAQDETGQPFDQFAVGNYGIEGKEGTFRDAEDGELSGNLVEHGGVDSVLRCSRHIGPDEQAVISYWIVAADSQFDAEIIHHVLLQHGLAARLEHTRSGWREWLKIGAGKIDRIDPQYKSIAKKSLMVVKAHIDQHGGVIASCDSSIYNYGRDYYSYVWPRDGALTMLPLIELGYRDEPKRFFEFCVDTMHPNGYMMHKYQPDKAIGSTWHPLVHRHHPELAIQEDETAIVVYAIGKYLETSGDDQFVKGIFNDFVKPAADFMSLFIDNQTGLPHASYDLWEEHFATHTYTAVIVIAALEKAASMAQIFDYGHDAQKWQSAAKRINQSMSLLFNNDNGFYRKSLLLLKNSELEFDDTIDSSTAYSLLAFGANNTETDRLIATYSAIEAKLLNSCPSGGVPRYEHDNYFLTHQEYPGNPWIICTLWLAQYYLKYQKLNQAKQLVDWVIKRAGPSGMLSEQIDPQTGRPLSVSPLVWSHAELMVTLLKLASTDRSPST